MSSAKKEYLLAHIYIWLISVTPYFLVFITFANIDIYELFGFFFAGEKDLTFYIVLLLLSILLLFLYYCLVFILCHYMLPVVIGKTFRDLQESEKLFLQNQGRIKGSIWLALRMSVMVNLFVFHALSLEGMNDFLTQLIALLVIFYPLSYFFVYKSEVKNKGS